MRRAVSHAIPGPGAKVASGAAAANTTTAVGPAILSSTIGSALTGSSLANAIVARPADAITTVRATFLAVTFGRADARKLVIAFKSSVAGTAVAALSITTLLVFANRLAIGRNGDTEVVLAFPALGTIAAIAHAVQDLTTVKFVAAASAFAIWWVIVDAHVVFAPFIYAAVAAATFASVVATLIFVAGIFVGA